MHDVSNKSLNCNECSQKVDLFHFLNEEQLNYLNKNKSEVKFNAGEIIFKQGGPLTHIACLTSGSVKIYLEEANSKHLILTILKPTGIVGGPGFMVDFKHHFSVSAIEDTTACFIEISAFKEVLLQNLEFAIQFIKYLNEIHIRLYNKLYSLTHKHMHERIAGAILYLSDVYGSLDFKTQLSRQDLADMSALTKESAIRILKEFKDEGFITLEGNHYKILDKESLINVGKTR